MDKEEKIDHVPFKDGYTLSLFKLGKEYIYTFKDKEGNETGKYGNNEPLTLTEMSVVGREIKKHLNPNGDFTNSAVSKKFERVKILLHEIIETAILTENNVKKDEKLKQEQYLEERLKEAQEVLENKFHPLIYIGSLVSWMTAGERSNIMLTFIAYSSQVILNSPISVIGLGEGSSGKTHIQEVAMNLIPSEYIRHEKGSTGATTFNRAKDDEYYYDGCVVNFGDLGGKNSQDFVMEAKNLLKELQSDGFVNKPLNIPVPDVGWMVIDLTLYGRPCLTYTTVPGFDFDDQEMSRSIFITPRMDNKAVFNARKQIMELKHGKTYKKFERYDRDIQIVKYMVQLIRDKMENITIINPYTKDIIDFLGESEYFKRDFDKYNGILKTITAFNVFGRGLFDLDGEQILFTSLNDIKIFKSLLMTYHDSISVNISPKSSEILKDLRDNLKTWKGNDYVESLLGITINEYLELSTVKLSKRSIRRYFSELNDAGFLKVTGQKGRANIYDLSEKDIQEDIMSNGLSDAEKNLIFDELGKPALDFILEDVAMDGLTIMLQDEDVDPPGWELYDQ